jgi:hypothetical protein
MLRKRTMVERLEAELERNKPLTTNQKIEEIKLMLSAIEVKPKKPVKLTIQEPPKKAPVKNAFRKIRFKGIEQSLSNPKNKR